MLGVDRTAPEAWRQSKPRGCDWRAGNGNRRGCDKCAGPVYAAGRSRFSQLTTVAATPAVSSASAAAPICPGWSPRLHWVRPSPQRRALFPMPRHRFASLLARLGVSLSKVAGRGPKGRITHEDVQAFVKAALSRPEGTVAPVAGAGGGLDLLPWPQVDFAKFGPIERQPLSRIKNQQGQSAPQLDCAFPMSPIAMRPTSPSWSPSG